MFQGRSLCDGIVDPSRCTECVLEGRGAPAPIRSVLAGLPEPISRLTGAMHGAIGTAFGMRDLISRNLSRQCEMLNAVEAFVVLTERAAAIVRANGAPASKVFVNRLGIRDGIDAAGAAPASRDTGPIRIGYVGRFEHVKGVIDLAEAVRRLPSALPVHVEFRGPAQSAADRATRALVAETSASDPRVAIANGVAPESIVDVLRSYDVICCPSRCLEGGPTVALEAMALGIPVIAASVGGVAEIVEDGVNARLVPPGDVGRLSEALIEVATDPMSTIHRWRKRLPPSRRMHDVTREYLDLYSRN